MKVISISNYVHKSEHIEHPFGDSETVPGQAESISALLYKYQRGIIPPINKKAYYDENANLDFINPLQTSSDPLTTRQDMLTDLDYVKSVIQNSTSTVQTPEVPATTQSSSE